MTTVATDGRTIAGDGRSTSGGLIVTDEKIKVHRLSDGRICGLAGNVAAIELTLDWLLNGGEKPVLLPEDDDLNVLILNPDGTVEEASWRLAFVKVTPPAAAGSGWMMALVAMDLGLSPRQAVEAVAKRDSRTGGKITVLSAANAPGADAGLYDAEQGLRPTKKALSG